LLRTREQQSQESAGLTGILPSSCSRRAALRLALEGAGIVRLADIVVAEPIRRGLLVPLLADTHYAEPVALSALYLAGRHRLPKVRVFLDFLIERFSSAPWNIAAAEQSAARA
jgi:DNA-binding transcriptional LysR family regulator